MFCLRPARSFRLESISTKMFAITDRIGGFHVSLISEQAIKTCPLVTHTIVFKFVMLRGVRVV